MKALVVGAGFSGLTAARQLAERGYRVVVLEARDHLGGNAIDCIDAETGVRYHPYGPHLFHTNSDKVFAYLSRFTEWTPYVHRVRSQTPYGVLQFPINLNTLRAVFPGEQLYTTEDVAGLLRRLGERSRSSEPGMSGAMRALIGDTLFELFYEGYSTKQWGRPTTDLPAPIAKRIPVRDDEDDRYFSDKYQALPRDGYEGLFKRMANHPNIKVKLGTRCASGDVFRALQGGYAVVYTGPLDTLFNHEHGQLEYRSLRFEWLRGEPQRQDVVKNYPSAEVPYTRETEFGLLPNSPAVGGSLVAREYPSAEGDPYYPLPDDRNRELVQTYKQMAGKYPRLVLCGRLAEYRYYNMDQAVASALSKIGALL